MTATDTDIQLMRRALQLAANGRGNTSPNPMVGAVITANGRIIGEGWHRCYGGPHAEVNAVASVSEADAPLLKEATIYVTLEPCSHYGKTPPCAKLLIDKGLRRVVVGAGDPNPKVAGRGIAMLREAGITVVENVLADESRELNLEFMTAHSRRMPFVTLKWAQSADGFLDGHFSEAVGQQIVHRRRANADAIIAGARTVIADNPRLDTRRYAGRSPRPVILDRHDLLVGSDYTVMKNPDTLHITSGAPLREILESLYRDYGYISVMVEGGAGVLNEFLAEGCWDRAYVERSPKVICGTVAAPVIAKLPSATTAIGANTIFEYRNE